MQHTLVPPRLLTGFALLFVCLGAWAGINIFFGLAQHRLSMSINVLLLPAGIFLLQRHPMGRTLGIAWAWLSVFGLLFIALTLLLNDPVVSSWGIIADYRSKLRTILGLLGQFCLAVGVYYILTDPRVYHLLAIQTPEFQPWKPGLLTILSVIFVSILGLYATTYRIHQALNSQLTVRVTGQPSAVFKGNCGYKVVSFASLQAGNTLQSQRDYEVDVAGAIGANGQAVEIPIIGRKIDCVVRTTSPSAVRLSILQGDTVLGIQDPDRSGTIRMTYRVPE